MVAANEREKDKWGRRNRFSGTEWKIEMNTCWKSLPYIRLDQIL